MMGLLSKILIFNRERMMERVFRVGQEKLKYIENGTNEILKNHQENAELKIAGQKIGITSKQLEIKINHYDGIQSSKE